MEFRVTQSVWKQSMFSGWEGQILPISTVIRDKWASSYTALSLTVHCSLWEAAAVGGLDSLLENWRSLFGDKKNGITLSGDRNSVLKFKTWLCLSTHCSYLPSHLGMVHKGKNSTCPTPCLNSPRLIISKPLWDFYPSLCGFKTSWAPLSLSIILCKLFTIFQLFQDCEIAEVSSMITMHIS